MFGLAQKWGMGLQFMAMRQMNVMMMMMMVMMMMISHVMSGISWGNWETTGAVLGTCRIGRQSNFAGPPMEMGPDFWGPSKYATDLLRCVRCRNHTLNIYSCDDKFPAWIWVYPKLFLKCYPDTFPGMHTPGQGCHQYQLPSSCHCPLSIQRPTPSEYQWSSTDISVTSVIINSYISENAIFMHVQVMSIHFPFVHWSCVKYMSHLYLSHLHGRSTQQDTELSVAVVAQKLAARDVIKHGKLGNLTWIYIYITNYEIMYGRIIHNQLWWGIVIEWTGWFSRWRVNSIDMDIETGFPLGKRCIFVGEFSGLPYLQFIASLKGISFRSFVNVDISLRMFFQ